MSLLIDTHVFIWAAESPERLGKTAKATLLDPNETLYVSSVSTLELVRLAAREHIKLSSPVDTWCLRARAALGAKSVAVDDRIALEAYALPGAFHADPADRLLVATARVHGWRLMTADQRIVKSRAVRTVHAGK